MIDLLTELSLYANGLDKRAVVGELRRVLKASGRAVVAEITFSEARAPREMPTVDDWFR